MACAYMHKLTGNTHTHTHTHTHTLPHSLTVAFSAPEKEPLSMLSLSGDAYARRFEKNAVESNYHASMQTCSGIWRQQLKAIVARYTHANRDGWPESCT